MIDNWDNKLAFLTTVGLITLILIVISIGVWTGTDRVSPEQIGQYEKYAAEIKETYYQMEKCKKDPEKINESNVECLLFMARHLSSQRYRVDEEMMARIERQNIWKDIPPKTVKAIEQVINEFVVGLIKAPRVQL